MAKNKSDEVKQLKKDYFELAEIHREERGALLNIINTFSLVASYQEDIALDIQSVKKLISPDGELPLDDIEDGIRTLKNKIIARENESQPDNKREALSQSLGERLVESCRVIKKIMVAILDDFYPLTEELAKKAENISIDCRGDISQIELKQPSEDLLKFIDRIKFKISDDFKNIKRVFFTLLEQVKELEKSLTNEFAGEDTLKEIEYFEMRIDKEVGLIAESFNIHTTISEVKNVVFNKLKKNKKPCFLTKKRRAGKKIK